MLNDTRKVRREFAKRLGRIKNAIERGDDLNSIGTDFDVLASYIQSEEDLTAEFIGEDMEARR